MGLRAGLDWCEKSRLTGIRSPDRPARRESLYRLRYPAHRPESYCKKSCYTAYVFVLKSVSCSFMGARGGAVDCGTALAFVGRVA